FASFQYKVTSKKLTRVKYYLDHMNNGTIGELTEEERAEMEALQTELCFKPKAQPVCAVENNAETESVSENLDSDNTDNE
ncbi:MAG: hypothetical protein ACI4SK_02460, partial [Christensenellales bacterium]